MTMKNFLDNEHARQVEIKRYSYSQNTTEARLDTVVAERRLKICLHTPAKEGGHKEYELFYLPGAAEELIIGFLYTSGLIVSYEGLLSLRVSPDGTEAEAYIADKGARELSRLPDVEVDMATLKSMTEAFRKTSPLFDATGAIHCCYLAVSGKIKYYYEDIGRHNAVDKAVGKALIENIDFSKSTILTSGRVPYNLAHKIIMAGIPVLVARSAPTDAAVAIAREYNLRLLGFAGAAGFNAYN